MFTYENYNKIITGFLESGYNFRSFCSKDYTALKNIYLRHDVDIDIWGSIELARIEEKNGVNSIFFFQPNAELYNIFSKECSEIIDKINKMGHEIGLHIDAAFFKNQNDLYEYICETHHYYSRYLPLSKVISFHRPAPFILNSEIRIEGFINTYDKAFFKEIIYVSDSNRREFWKQENWNDALNSKKSLQFLTHPIWWGHYHQSVYEVENNYIQKYVNYSKRALSRVGGSFEQINNWVNGGDIKK